MHSHSGAWRKEYDAKGDSGSRAGQRSGSEKGADRSADAGPKLRFNFFSFSFSVPAPESSSPSFLATISLRSRGAVIFYSFICRLSTAHVTSRPRPTLHQPQQSSNQYSERRYQRYHRSETRFNEEGVNKITSSLIPKERFHKYTFPVTQ